MDDSEIRVLLVGDSPESFSLIRELLEKRGCECHFAGSLEAVKNLLRLWQFAVVLSTHGIPSYAIQTLVGLLSGSRSSLFSPRGGRFLVVACSAMREGVLRARFDRE